MSEQRAAYGGLVETCDVMGDDASVLAVDDELVLMMLRAWCGADAANVAAADAGVAVAQFVDRARVTCTNAYIVGRTAATLEPFAALTDDAIEIIRTSAHHAEPTLDRRPNEYRTQEFRLTVAGVRLDDRCPTPETEAG
jgi:hypothetical protein